MSKLKKISKLKIFIALFILAAIAFGIYNIIWFNYSARFEPFLNSEKMQALILQSETENDPNIYRLDKFEGYKRHLYRDHGEGGSGYSYEISVPPYLKFDGHIGVLTPKTIQMVDDTMVYLNECEIRLSISLKKWEYELSIADLTTVKDVNSPVSPRHSIVDKNGQPLERPARQTEKEHQEWLALYEKFEDEIVELFETINSSEYFGDALR